MSASTSLLSCSFNEGETIKSQPNRNSNLFKTLLAPDLMDKIGELDKRIQQAINATECLSSDQLTIVENRIVSDVKQLFVDYEAYITPFFKGSLGLKKLHEISEEELGNLFAFMQVQDIFNSLKLLNPNQVYLSEIQRQIEANIDVLKKILVDTNGNPTKRATDCEYGQHYIHRIAWYDYSPGRINSNPMVFNVIRVMAIFFTHLTVHDIAAPMRLYLSNELMLGKDIVLKNDKFRDSTIMMFIFNLLNHHFDSLTFRYNKTPLRRNRLRLDPYDTFQEIKTKLMLIDEIAKKLDFTYIIDYKRKEDVTPYSSSTDQVFLLKNEIGILPTIDFENICLDLGRAYLEKFTDCPLYLHSPFLSGFGQERNNHYLLHSLHRLMKNSFHLTMKLHQFPPTVLDLFDQSNINMDQGANQVIYQRNAFKSIEDPQRLSEDGKDAQFSYQFVKSYELSNFFIENKLILGTTQDPASVTKELIKQINKDILGVDSYDSPFLKMTNHFHQGTEIKLRRLLGEVYFNMGQNFPISIASEFPNYYQIFKDKQGRPIYRLVAVASLYVQEEDSSHIQKRYHVLISDYMTDGEFEGYRSATYISSPFSDLFDKTGNPLKRASQMVMDHLEKIFSAGIYHLLPWDKFQISGLSSSSGIYPALFSPVQGSRKSSYTSEVQIIREEGKKLPYEMRANLEFHLKRLCANPHEISVMMIDNIEGLINLKELANHVIEQSNLSDSLFEDGSQLRTYACEFLRIHSLIISDYDLLSDMKFMSDKIEIPRDKITEAQKEFYSKLPPQKYEMESEVVANTKLKIKYMTHVDLLEEIKNTCTNLSSVFRFDIDGKINPIIIADEFIDALSRACRKKPPMSVFVLNGVTTKVSEDSYRRSMIKLNSYFQGNNSTKYRMALIDFISSKKASLEGQVHIVKPLCDAIKSLRTQDEAVEIGTILVGEVCETFGGIRTVDFSKLKLLLSNEKIKGVQWLARALQLGVKKVLIESIRTFQERVFRDLVLDKSDRAKFKEALTKLSYHDFYLDLRGIYIIAQLAQAHGNMPIYCFKNQMDHLNESIRQLDLYNRFTRVSN